MGFSYETNEGGALKVAVLARRKIVCLCGSTRFRDAFEFANLRETMRGNIVLSVGCYAHDDDIELSEAQKARLDVLHFDKIDLADEVFVVNPDGYIGDSTRREIAYAYAKGKPVRALTPFGVEVAGAPPKAETP